MIGGPKKVAPAPQQASFKNIGLFLIPAAAEEEFFDLGGKHQNTENNGKTEQRKDHLYVRILNRLFRYEEAGHKAAQKNYESYEQAHCVFPFTGLE